MTITGTGFSAAKDGNITCHYRGGLNGAPAIGDDTIATYVSDTEVVCQVPGYAGGVDFHGLLNLKLDGDEIFSEGV